MGRAKAEYRTRFTLLAAVGRKEAKMLRFTGVDYKAHVFLNGILVGSHEGFFAPFEFVITEYLKTGENELLVVVENDAIARGNQSWFQDAEGEKLYAATFVGWDEPELAWHHGPPGMGIWGSVRIEGRSETHIGDLFVRPLPEEETAELWIEVFNTRPVYAENLSFRWSLYGQNFKARLVEEAPVETKLRFGPNQSVLKYRIRIPKPRIWHPDAPWLYQLQLKLYRGGKLQDTLAQPFGMRSFRIDETTTPKGKIFLNGEAIRLRNGELEKLVAKAESGARIILYRLPTGGYSIDGETVSIVETANEPRYCASRNTGHPIVSGFQPNDFRFWLDETTGYPTPFHDTTFVSDKWIPIIKTATGFPRTHPLVPPTDRIFRPSHVVAEKSVGKGSVVICQLCLDNYVDVHPVARVFAEGLITATS